MGISEVFFNNKLLSKVKVTYVILSYLKHVSGVTLRKHSRMFCYWFCFFVELMMKHQHVCCYEANVAFCFLMRSEIGCGDGVQTFKVVQLSYLGYMVK